MEKMTVRLLQAFVHPDKVQRVPRLCASDSGKRQRARRIWQLANLRRVLSGRQGALQRTLRAPLHISHTRLRIGKIVPGVQESVGGKAEDCAGCEGGAWESIRELEWSDRGYRVEIRDS